MNDNQNVDRTDAAEVSDDQLEQAAGGAPGYGFDINDYIISPNDPNPGGPPPFDQNGPQPGDLL